jgi:small subunit ribosomal protein S23
MGRHFRPARVFQTAKNNISSQLIYGKKPVPPAWFKALERIPPSEILTRSYPIQHGTAPKRGPLRGTNKAPRNVFRPTKITFIEDSLRNTFYKDHPWELARPKMVLELDGKDAQYLDWSKGLIQLGMPLCGERCVWPEIPEAARIPSFFFFF